MNVEGVVPATAAAVAGIAAFAGVFRGITGFGGAMVMGPPLALLLGPAPMVAVVLLLEGIVALTLVPHAWRQARPRLVLPLCAAAWVTAPFGAWMLSRLDPALAKRATAVLVLAFCALLATGYRYHGRQRLPTSLALGGIAGALVGATGVGAPPVIVYLLAGPDDAAVTRANLIVFVTAISLAGFVGVAVTGLLTASALAYAALAALPFFAGMRGGMLLFPRFGERRFRWLALGLLATIAAITLML